MSNSSPAEPGSNRHIGKVAYITGGASGIGLEIAQRLRGEGAQVGILDLNIPPDPEFAFSQVDLADEQAVRASCAELARDLGPADIGIHAAAAQIVQPFDSLSSEQWQLTFRVNVDGAFFFAQSLLPAMRAKGWGRLLFIASSSYVSPPPAMSHYIASKGALIGLARGLAKEVGTDGVTVNALAPGLTRTDNAIANIPQEFFDLVASQQAIHRSGEASDQAAAASFLVSDDAGFITGQTLLADGGEGFL